MVQTQTAPATLTQVLSFIEGMSEDKFQVLRRSLSGPLGYKIRQQEIDALALNLDVSSDTGVFILRALAYFYNQIEPSPSEQLLFERKVEALAERVQEGSVQLASRLLELLAYSPERHMQSKIERLEAGFIANVTSVHTFLDLRPSFSSDRKIIEGLVPVFQVNIITDSPRNYESSIVFQLDIKGLRELKRAIDDAEQKLDLARLDTNISALKLMSSEI